MDDPLGLQGRSPRTLQRDGKSKSTVQIRALCNLSSVQEWPQVFPDTGAKIPDMGTRTKGSEPCPFDNFLILMTNATFSKK